MKLDKDRILELLTGADTRWFKIRSGQFNYREHLEFTADYIVRNYHIESSKAKTIRGAGEPAIQKVEMPLRF